MCIERIVRNAGFAIAADSLAVTTRKRFPFL